VAYVQQPDGSAAAVLPVGATRLRWYREVLTVAVFYAAYSAIRNVFGSNAVAPDVALANAERVIRLQQALRLYVEPDVQRVVLDWSTTFIRFWNLYYGTLHFVVTGGIMVWLFRRHPAAYPRRRNTLAAMTGLALAGFSLFPLMPPRLLAATGPFGGGDLRHAGAFVDTLAEFPTLWSFSSTTMQTVSNQYAAMPSLHVGWSLWCVVSVLPFLRSRIAKLAVTCYVPATVFAIVVTANHYWIDAVGGAAVFGVAMLVAGRIEALKTRSEALAAASVPGGEGEGSTASLA
jgi:hypothetical protein